MKLEGVPVVWETNLTDDEFRDFYAILVRDPYFIRSMLQPRPAQGDVPGRWRLNIFCKIYEFREGACACVGGGGKVSVTYCTHTEWEIWEAQQAEILEFEDEQKQELEMEKLLFLVEDDHLKEKITTGLESGEYASVFVRSRQLPPSR